MSIFEDFVAKQNPSNFIDGKEFLVIGNDKNFLSGGVYSKVVKHTGIKVVTEDTMTSEPIGGMLWMNGIVGDGWGWNFEKVKQAYHSVRDRFPSIKILGNYNFTDDKNIVESKFLDAFGYDLGVDPTIYQGSVVKKSRVQARHDGEIINCPIKLEEVDDKFSYSKLIDNSLNDFIVDIRAVIFDGEIPFCYIKFRPKETRFSNVNSKVFLVSPSDVLSKSEIRLVLDFANKMLLEVGEVDILRDNFSRDIYIVDANNTPSGPPNGLSSQESTLAIRILSDKFVSKFC
ncbi:hypothetical protein [Bizionia sp.]|uniref:hypothetical protein n=1 Tax=Bizionia sp. TaxID=1954480 RepID=UPI003A912A5E